MIAHVCWTRTGCYCCYRPIGLHSPHPLHTPRQAVDQGKSLEKLTESIALKSISLPDHDVTILTGNIPRTRVAREGALLTVVPEPRPWTAVLSVLQRAATASVLLSRVAQIPSVQHNNSVTSVAYRACPTPLATETWPAAASKYD